MAYSVVSMKMKAKLKCAWFNPWCQSKDRQAWVGEAYSVVS